MAIHSHVLGQELFKFLGLELEILQLWFKPRGTAFSLILPHTLSISRSLWPLKLRGARFIHEQNCQISREELPHPLWVNIIVIVIVVVVQEHMLPVYTVLCLLYMCEFSAVSIVIWLPRGPLDPLAERERQLLSESFRVNFVKLFNSKGLLRLIIL